MNKASQIVDFIQYNLKTLSSLSTKNAFVQDFVSHVIEDDRKFYDFANLESLRHHYISNNNMIDIVELGAGSSYGNAEQKRISEVAKQQLSSPYQLRTIYRICNWLHAKNIVELGASLGLSSLYLASADRNSQVISFEGNPHFIKFIEFQKQQLGVNNLSMIEGNFDDTYKAYTEAKPKIDVAFIDGNHRQEATINYFNWTLPCTNEHSILVFDDIHWSAGMHDAWKTIIDHPQVTGSIDMYMMGIVFFHPDANNAHLHIRPKKWM